MHRDPLEQFSIHIYLNLMAECGPRYLSFRPGEVCFDFTAYDEPIRLGWLHLLDMMGPVDEEQIVQAEPREDRDYAGSQKKALLIVYSPSVAAFTYCEQPQVVCSGSALVKSRACRGRALCHSHLARRLHSNLAHHVLDLGSQAFVTFCLDCWTVMTL